MAEGPKPCGSCDLCCTLLDVPELDKPALQRCVHQRATGGCAIHATRPALCRTFQCQWTLTPQMPEDWRPDLSHFILWAQVDNQLIVEVDPAFPTAWRQAPYYGVLKRWSAAPGMQVLIRIDTRMWMMFPEADVDMGVQQLDKTIDWGYRTVAGRRTPYARFVDPAP